jgi:hypothetical protein
VSAPAVVDDCRAIRTRREYVLRVLCPTCKAEPHKLCREANGDAKEGCHDARHVRAVALGAPRNPPYSRPAT